MMRKCADKIGAIGKDVTADKPSLSFNMDIERATGIAAILIMLSFVLLAASRCNVEIRVVDSAAVDCTPAMNGDELDKP